MANRRDFVKASAIGAGAIAFSPVYNNLFAETNKVNGTPKRFVFIRKSSGIRPLEVALPSFSKKEKETDEKKEPFPGLMNKCIVNCRFSSESDPGEIT